MVNKPIYLDVCSSLFVWRPFVSRSWFVFRDQDGLQRIVPEDLGPYTDDEYKAAIAAWVADSQPISEHLLCANSYEPNH